MKLKNLSKAIPILIGVIVMFRADAQDSSSSVLCAVSNPCEYGEVATSAVDTEGASYGQTTSNHRCDVSTIANAFLSKFSGGIAPWTCLNYTAAKRVDGGSKRKNSDGTYTAAFAVPLTISGKPIVYEEQSRKTLEWDIYLCGPLAGATSLAFDAAPQFVDLGSVAEEIAKSLNAKLLKNYEADDPFGGCSIDIYAVGSARLAIWCSFGVHGGSMTVVLGSPTSVDEYVQKWRSYM
jgi:hypothetical protein